MPTGFAALDNALEGGIPRGRVTQLSGAPTSGATSIGLKMAAAAQQDLAAEVVYIDNERSFDPHFAGQCGIKLDQFTLARPTNDQQALAMLAEFGAGGGVTLVVFDSPLHLSSDSRLEAALASSLNRLALPLAGAGCAVVLLTQFPSWASSAAADYPRHAALAHQVWLRLLIRRQRWLFQRRDVRGYQTQIAILKNKGGPAGKRVRVRVPIIFGNPADDKP